MVLLIAMTIYLFDMYEKMVKKQMKRVHRLLSAGINDFSKVETQVFLTLLTKMHSEAVFRKDLRLF